MEPRFLKSRSDEFNYLYLLLTIVAGVTLGNLLSGLITAQVLAYQARQAVMALSAPLGHASRAAQAAATEALERSAAEQAARLDAQRRQRAADPTGQRLAQACREWQQADASLHSETTRVESARHCHRLDQYILSGVLPAVR